MDSKTPLDYALFQLTPTRTRCDLVIIAGKKKEKIASGLLEPFVSHLKSAKDQISKGEYSITLHPASPDDSSWFTKATLERFVRFVSTPEILERFVTIERETSQIERSIESNDETNGTVELPGNASATDGDPKTPFAPSKSSDHAESEENPKIRLQRVLESRKAMLKKEQAMAYARALVAGFEVDYLYDLVSFSGAFGAQRLREACMNFMELCNKKNDDKNWMDEVAAMQASYLGTPGIILAGENNDLPKSSASHSITRHASMDTSEGKLFSACKLLELSNMQNSQAPPIFQPYPGYIFPGMQVGPSHYPGNMPWPANFHDSHTPPDREIRDSQKHNKSSSRKLVIRNINYIAQSSNENSNDSADGYSSDEVETAVGSLKKHNKPNSIKSKIRDGSNKKASNKSKNDLDAESEKKAGSWDIFQNLLMRDSASNSTDTGSKSIQVQEEYSSQKAYRDESLSSLDKKTEYTCDDFLFTERSTGNGFGETDVKFEGGENFHGVVKRRSKDEEFLIPPRAAEGEYYPQKSHFTTEPSIVKTRKDEDWIIGSKSEIIPGGDNIDYNIFSGDQAASAHHNIQIEENKKDVLLDDSFMVQSRISDGPPQTQPKDDIFMVTDIVGDNHTKNKVQVSNNFYVKMMLGHDSVTEQGVAYWSNEMDYKNDVLLVEIVGSQNKAEPSDSVDDDATQARNGKASKIGASKESKSKAPSGSLGRSKSDIPSRSKISTAGITMIRSKSEKEEEKKKRMEELLIQRQKRIAERSAANKVATSEISKRSSKESKKNNSISTKAKLRGPPVMRSSTMDRLAAARKTNKTLSTEPKVGQNKKPTPKGNSVTPTSWLKKTKGTQEQKKDKVGPSDKKNGTDNPKTSYEKSENFRVKNGIIEDSKSVNVLHTVSSFEKRESNTISVTVDKNSVHINISDKDLLLPSEDNVDDQLGLRPQITVNPTVGNDLKSNVLIVDEKKKLSFSPEISVVEISTPPPTDEMNQELIHSRKKWNNGESSPKIPKGFRRLLLFGRRT